MGRKRIITGQYVAPVKLARAKQLRSNATPEEQILWERLRRGQVNGLHFRRQQPIAGFIVDFYGHEATLVVEVDGPVHERTRDYDLARARVITARDIAILRLPSLDVASDVEAVLAAIARVAAERIAGAGKVIADASPSL